MSRRLPSKMATLLDEILLRRCPNVGFVPDTQLSESQREELRQAVTDELIETGLQENDEPNQSGLLLEELIDRLGNL